MNIKAFAGMTDAQFLGTPKIVTDIDVKLQELPSKAPLEPFLGEYQAKFDRARVQIFDGGKFIAAHWRGDPPASSAIYVDPFYRNKGLAVEMIYQLAIRTGKPTPGTVRTAEGHAVYAKAWSRIQADLATNRS